MTLIVDSHLLLTKFGMNVKPTYEQLQFRQTLLEEEVDESLQALQNYDPDDWVDAQVDLIVIALGNLALAGVDIQQAWDEVFKANISKERGVKPGRESSGGFDLIKPAGWVGPSHEGNHGYLWETFGVAGVTHP